MPTKLIRAHLILTAIAGLDFLLMLTYGISFRGQWLDILLSMAPFTTALILVVGYWRGLSLFMSIYLGVVVGLCLLASPLYVLSTVWTPLQTYTRLGPYEVRERPGLLNPPAVIVLEGIGPFEIIRTGMIDPQSESAEGERQLRLVHETDSLRLRIPKSANEDTSITICRY